MTLGLTSVCLITLLPFDVYTIEPDYAYVENDSLVQNLLHLDWDVWCQLQPNGFDCAHYGKANKFYYDIVLQDCKAAPSGSCKFNLNRFNTITECHDTCRDYGQHLIPDDLAPKLFCRLQPDFGSCNSYYPRFYFDVTERRCKGFSFSGCGGNFNRFATFQMCSAVCSPLITYERDKEIDS